MNCFVEKLELCDKLELPVIGGKAFNLVKLIRAGFPVPPGFCITSRAYEGFIGRGNLKREIQSLVSSIQWERINHIKSWSQAIKELIMQQEYPGRVRDAVLFAWRQFRSEAGGGFRAAVRSSAALEDSAELSFAGQYDSYLNISSEDELLAGVKKCWASLWSDRALTYYHSHNLDCLAVSMAVVVQVLVDAEVSGVMFTANPINQDQGEMVIHGAWGLGGTIAAGKSLADEFLVDKDRMQIRSSKIHEKRLMVVPGEQGTIECPVPEIKQDRQSLSIEQVLRLAVLGRKIETLLDAPQDIEWALSREQIFILQSRPITSLLLIHWGNEATRQLFAGHVVFWSNFNTRETLPYPLTPMSASYFMDLLFPVANESWLGITEESRFYAYGISLDLIYSRLYWNMNMVFATPLGQQVKKLDHETGVFFEELYRQGRLYIPRPPKGFLRFWLSLFFASRLIRSLFRIPWFAGRRGIEKRNRALWQWGSEFEELNLESRSTRQLIRDFKDFNIRMARIGFPLLLITVVKGLLGLNLLEKLTRKWEDIPFTALLAGIEGNKTTDGALELYKLSIVSPQLRQQLLDTGIGGIPLLCRGSKEGQVFLDRLNEFLNHYGHRGVKEFDIGQPRWCEDFSFVLQMIKNYLQLTEGEETPLLHFERMKREREQVTALALARLVKLFPIKKWLFKKMLRMAHFYIPQRENNKYYALKFFFASRRVLLEIGRRLCDKGWLGNEGEIFYLTLPELESFARHDFLETRIKELVGKRKSAWQKHQCINPPLIIRSDGKRIEFQPDTKEKEGALILQGAAASRGKVTGTARLIMDPADGSEFNKGEILVAPYTDPGWTPLFLTAKALVMEAGGIFSHGAVVAREYGIPALVGVKGAVEKIKTGDKITVDGNEGQVIIHNRWSLSK